MKKVTQRSRFSAILLLLAGSLLFAAACKKEAVKEPENNSSDELLSKLKGYGVDEKNIVDIGDYYCVGGDMLFDKKKTDLDFLDRYFSLRKNKGKEIKNVDFFGRKPDYDQQTTPYVVSSSFIEAINVNVISTGLPQEWVTGIHEAMTKWAELSDTKINFYYQFTGEPAGDINITFRHDNGVLDNFTVAAAKFPTVDGKPGFEVIINLDFYNNYPVTQSGKLYNMVHEIGHCIGLWHTNESGGTQIPGTPASDANSVMNGGTALNTWAGFSSGDVNAVNYLYPWSNPTDKWITAPDRKFPLNIVSVEEDDLLLTWNSALHATSTITVRIYKNNVLAGTIYSNIANTGSVTIPKAVLAPYNPGGLQTLGNFRLEIVSDANPSIKDITSNFVIGFSS